MSKNKKATRYYSTKQEKAIADYFGFKLVKNSGASMFGVCDIIGEHIVIEAKTSMKPQKSFSIKKEWLDDIQRAKYVKGKDFGAVAIDFGNPKQQYLIFSQEDAKVLLDIYKEHLENINEGE